MKSRVRVLIIIALFPALMGATAGVSIPLLGLPPITLQSLFVFLAGLLLHPKESFYSMTIYLLLGIIGIPVFAGYRAGLAVLLGPSGGFLLAFPFIALLISVVRSIFNKKNIFIKNIILLFMATIVLYMIGSTYISIVYKSNLFLTLSGFSLYLVGDIFKLFLAAYIHMRIHSFVTYE